MGWRRWRRRRRRRKKRRADVDVAHRDALPACPG